MAAAVALYISVCHIRSQTIGTNFARLKKAIAGVDVVFVPKDQVLVLTKRRASKLHAEHGDDHRLRLSVPHSSFAEEHGIISNSQELLHHDNVMDKMHQHSSTTGGGSQWQYMPGVVSSTFDTKVLVARQHHSNILMSAYDSIIRAYDDWRT
jgi:hypothetical protein